MTAINLATYFLQPLPKTWRIINKAAGRQVAITLSLITHLRTAIFASVAKSTEEKYHLLKTKKLVLLYECAAKLVSFGWSHPKIFSTHSKGRCVFEERQYLSLWE